MTEDSIQYQKTVPVIAEPDVLVVGAGPAGIAAAIGAARAGARTMIVERFGFVGGNLTAGLVGPCMTSYSLDGETQLIRGVFDEMIVRMEEMGKAIHPSKVPASSPWCGFIEYGHDKVTPFDPEAVKLVALDMLREAGVEILLHTFVADAIVEDSTVRGVIAVNKSGMQAIRAGVTVDCSADGDVAARAGAAFEMGRDEDGLVQPMTLFFRVSHVDDAVVEEYVYAHPDDYRPFSSLVMQAREAGLFPIPRRGVGMYRTLEPGVWRINTTRMQMLDGTNAQDLTRGEIEGREQIKALMKFFREWLPGFENCQLYDSAATVGVRETRRIVGEYTLTYDDLLTGRHFDDVIALCGYPLDIHSPNSDGGGTDGALETANEYEIPYRSLVPRDMNGLLVAGRCISATHVALSAIRVMPPAFAMGQAAGVAAAMAIEWNLAPRDIPVPQLQELLLRQGAYLGEGMAAGVSR
ncbi:MAG: FAD-dependent oxidoreductase [Thermomicrobiales bacterium]